MAAVKSDLIKELSNNYPSFYKKDLVKLFDIAMYEIQESLKRGERVEPRIQKARISRNPKTNEQVNTPEKKTISFKISKEWTKKINDK